MAYSQNYGPVSNQAGKDIKIHKQENHHVHNHYKEDPDDRLPPVAHELPRFILTSYFTGRRNELENIHRAFDESSGNPQSRCMIHGMPGVGKTQLALKFGRDVSQDGKYPYIFWVSAVSVEKLSQDISKIAELLRLPGRYMLDQASRLTAVRMWLQDSTTAKNSLVILHNVSEETVITILRDFLPQPNRGGKILLTTRLASIAERFTALGGCLQVTLQTPEIVDAVRMLSDGAEFERNGREESNRADAERLVQRIGKLPVAIDQAASFMRATGASPQELLKILESDEVSEILSWENDLSLHETKSVIAIFTPALDRIQTTVPDAVTLLRLLCFCDPESISISIFTQGCKALHDADWERIPKEQTAILETTIDLFRSRTRLPKAIQEVERLSLAAQASEGADRFIRIHDLVHLLLRSKLMTDGERKQWLEVAIYIIYKAFGHIEDPRSPQNWSRCSRFIGHIESLESFAGQYGLEKKELLYASGLVGVYLHGCGLYEKATTLYKRTLGKVKNFFGERNIYTLTILDNLTVVLGGEGKYEEAEKLQRQTLALRESTLGEKHPTTLRSKNNLGGILRDQKKYEEAEGIQRQTLPLLESELGKKDESTLIGLHNLALTLANQNKYEEAEKLQRETLPLLESEFGKKYPTTLTSMNSLAETLRNQNKYEEAEGMQRQTLALMESELGKNHPTTLTSMSNLAFAVKGQGQARAAETISVLQRCFELLKQVLGPEHPWTEDTLNALREWRAEGA